MNGASLKPRGDIPILHGIRGCLALWVLLGHTLDACGGFIPVLSAPGVAVFAFMVMSGFLMALHYRLREEREPWRTPRTWVLFWLRRFFRIAPVYYVALLVAFMFHEQYMAHYYALQRLFPLWFIHPPQFVTPFDVPSLILHGTFLFGLFPAHANNNILPDWSIGLEMQFYFVFPFLMLFLRKFGPVFFSAACAIIVMLAWAMAPSFPQPSFLPLTLCIFAAGIFISEAFLDENRLRGAALLVLAVLMATIHAPFLFQVIPVAMMFVINFPSLFSDFKFGRMLDPIERLLGGDLGRFVGDRSYSVYLIHMLIIVPVMTFLSRFDWFLQAPPMARFGVVAPVIVLTCYVLGTVLMVIVENPFIKLGHRIAARLRA